MERIDMTMASDFVTHYSVDIVFCIDGTGSMDPVIDRVKRDTLSFPGDLASLMGARGKQIDSLRARAVLFRDYIANAEDAMLISDFFYLPSEAAGFSRCIGSIVPKGGGYGHANALEALAYAIRSDWLKTNSLMKRQIIILWTDAPPHDFGHAKPSPYYPAGMPESLSALSGWWGDGGSTGFMGDRAKRLVLFAPEDPTWDAISRSWNNTIYFPSVAGEGLTEYEYEQIINCIVNGI